MISLVVTADTRNYNPAERDSDFAGLLAKFKQPFEIVYVANADYPRLDELREIAKLPDRRLVVTTPSTNINTQIYTALDHTQNGDVLLATMDTNLDLIKKIITKHQEGADLVFVKQQENWFRSIFVGLGRVTYQMGLKILGRGRDMCCDARVLLINNRSVNTIILNPTLSKALRLVNPDPDRNMRIIEERTIYDNPTPEQKSSNNTFMALGIVAMFYIVALLVLAIVFPVANSGVFTIWILVSVIVWLILGIVGSVIVAKYIYNTRLGLPVAINLAGEPLINIQEVIASEYQTVFDTDESTENEEINTEESNSVDEGSNTEDLENSPTENRMKNANIIDTSDTSNTESEKVAENVDLSSTANTPSENGTTKKRGRPKKIQSSASSETVTAPAEENERAKRNTKENEQTNTTKNKIEKTKTTKSETKSAAKTTSTKTGAKKPAVSKVKSTRKTKSKK